jgi:hypothetical protein
MWQGREVEAVRDEWVVKMPTPANPLSIDFYGYRARAPQVPSGWAIDSLNYGFYSVRAPGASLQNVMAWGHSRGAQTIEPNFALDRNAVPNDPRYNDGALWGLNRIAGPAAWDISTGSRSIVMGVVDSGVDITHPDLAGNIWQNPGETAGNGIDDDGNGFIDDINGWNFGGNNADLTDNVGHGTHVAGTMGAVGNNNVGVVGVNWAASLMVLKLGDVPTTASATSAINYATAMRARGIPIVATNNSYGGPGASEAFEQAIQLNNSAGVLFVAAAGNSASNNDGLSTFPANYDVPNVISVAASTQADGLADFSNYGTTTVDIAAPGVGILSTVPTTEDPSGYAVYQGTSMAAPHVAGVAALYASAFLDTVGRLPTVAEMKSAILDGADVIPTVPGVSGLTNPLTGGVVAGNRRLNAFGALKQLSSSIRISDVTMTEGDAGQQTVQLTVSLAAPAERQVSVQWATRNGTARVSDDDYIAAGGIVTFEVGEQEKTIEVVVNGDRWFERNETFEVVLSNPENGILSDGVGQVTILNDDPRAMYVQVLPAAVVESTGVRASVMEFVVKFRGDGFGPFSLSYATRDGTARTGTDFRQNRGTVQILPGQSEKRILVSVAGDAALEQDEFFWLDVAGVNDPAIILSSSSVKGWILDDDSRFFTVAAGGASVAPGGTASFTVGMGRVGGYGEALPTAIFAGLSPAAVAASIRFETRFTAGNQTAVGAERRPPPGTNLEAKDGRISLGYVLAAGGVLQRNATATEAIGIAAVQKARSVSFRLYDPVNARLGTGSAKVDVRTAAFATVASRR